MKGLIVKDICMSLKYARMLLLIVVIYGVAGVLSKELGIFFLLPALLVSMLPNMMYSYDEREKWTAYVQALPVSRAQYISGKYIFGLIAITAYSLLMTVVYLVVGKSDVFSTVILLPTFGLLAPSVILPLMFALGSEKGRYAYYIFLGAIAAGTVVFTSGGSLDVMTSSINVPEWMLPLFAAAIYCISWVISIALYKRREL